MPSPGDLESVQCSLSRTLLAQAQPFSSKRKRIQVLLRIYGLSTVNSSSGSSGTAGWAVPLHRDRPIRSEGLGFKEGWMAGLVHSSGGFPLEVVRWTSWTGTSDNSLRRVRHRYIAAPESRRAAPSDFHQAMRWSGFWVHRPSKRRFCLAL